MKNSQKPEKTSGFLQAVNTSRIALGRIRASIYGDPVSEDQQSTSTLADQADNTSILAPTSHLDRKVFFFHVVKTGGVTFRRILASMLRSDGRVD